MKRRDFFATAFATGALTAGGFGLTALSARTARAQTRGIAPLATASARGRNGLVVTRVYPGPDRTTFLTMTRTQRGDQWRRVSVPAGFLRAAEGIVQDGSARLGFRERPANPLLWFEIQDLIQRGPMVAARVRGEGLPETDIQGTPGDDVPTAQSGLSIGWVLVALIIMVGWLGTLSILTGTPMSAIFRKRRDGLEFEITLGEEEQPPSAPVIHDPQCDIYPPINC